MTFNKNDKMMIGMEFLLRYGNEISILFCNKNVIVPIIPAMLSIQYRADSLLK